MDFSFTLTPADLAALSNRLPIIPRIALQNSIAKTIDKGKVKDGIAFQMTNAPENGFSFKTDATVDALITKAEKETKMDLSIPLEAYFGLITIAAGIEEIAKAAYKMKHEGEKVEA